MSIPIVFGGKYACSGSCRHGCQKNGNSCHQWLRSHKTAGNIDKKRNKDQTDYRVIQNTLICHFPDIQFCQDHTDNNHGQCRVAIAYRSQGAFQKSRKGNLCQHKKQAQKTCNNARMRDYFFYKAFPVRRLCKNRKPRGPHDNTLRNQVHGRHSQPHGAEYTFCHRISKKTGIGADCCIVQALSLRRIHFYKKHFSKHCTANLYQNGNHKNLGKRINNIR